MSFVCNCSIYKFKVTTLNDTIKDLRKRAELAEQLWKNAKDGTPVDTAGASTEIWEQMLEQMLKTVREQKLKEQKLTAANDLSGASSSKTKKKRCYEKQLQQAEIDGKAVDLTMSGDEQTDGKQPADQESGDDD